MGAIVAIDGPAGAGKSTVAMRTARELGFAFIDTGAMYRAVAWSSLQRQISANAAERITEHARTLKLQFLPSEPPDLQRLLVNGVDVTTAIRTPEISELTSTISAHETVRREVSSWQRRLALECTTGAVLEGRDIGTVVFPGADVKIFLTASPEVRARRRFDQLTLAGVQTSLDQVLAEQLRRDDRDAGRSVSPLKPAEDAILLNTDSLSTEQVIAEIVKLCRKRLSLKTGTYNR